MGLYQSKVNAVGKTFSKKDIRKWQKIIMKEYPSGSIDENGFLKFVKQFLRQYNLKFAQLVFTIVADDPDGHINFKDFIRALSATSKGNVDEKLEVIFNLLDLYSDDFLTQEKVRSMLRAILKILQAEGRNYEELKDPEIVEKWTNDMFSRFDVTNEGRLTVDNFRAACKENRCVIDALTLGPAENPVVPNKEEREKQAKMKENEKEKEKGK